MKKLLLVLSLFIVGCAPTSQPTIDPSISGPTGPLPPVKQEQLFISEVYATEDSTFGKAIEIQ